METRSSTARVRDVMVAVVTLSAATRRGLADAIGYAFYEKENARTFEAV